MDFFDSECYGLTRQLMASIGLWPYQKRKHRIVQLLCVSFILIQATVLQLTTFITHEYSMTLFIEVFSFDILCMIYVLKYNIVYFHSDHIKYLFDQIERDWKSIKNTDELKIMQQYAYNARFYTIFSASIVYPGTLAFILTTFVPDVLNVVLPLDEPRQRQLPFKIEPFLNYERYFYLIILIFITSAFLGMTVLMATENMYMLFIQHVCGLYKVISHRLRCAFNIRSSKMTPSKIKCRVCTNLLDAVNIHQHCLEFLKDIQRKFSLSYFVLCGFGVASLSINMFRLFLSINAHDVSESIKTGLFVYSHFCYIFWMNYFGQDLIDHGDYLWQEIYNAQWYAAPLHSQRLLLMILRQSMRNTGIIIGALFVPSLEGFATLISMSLSYCMVIYSIHT
ncbi:hypothetical protein HN011_007227 [Eciton burchellii]|nr:hypothetical protein HN011_007227 [Eciton burchellii]